MNCESAIKQLPLFLYGELSFDEEEALEQHLDACPACRTELGREKSLAHVLDSMESPLSAGLLEECREDLRRKLRGAGIAAPAARPAWWRRLGIGLPAAPGTGFGGLLRPAGALALVALGFFSARFTTAPAPDAGGLQVSGEPVISRVRLIEPGASGQVQLVVDETRQRTLSGRLDDAAIRNLLLSAARDPADPGLRVDSIDVLKRRGESDDVRQVLLYALQNDPNPGVRLKALEGLKSFAAEPQTRQTLSEVLLADDNPGVRIQAIDLLVQHGRPEMAGVLQELLKKEDNNYVRLRCQRILREMNASVETF